MRQARCIAGLLAVVLPSLACTGAIYEPSGSRGEPSGPFTSGPSTPAVNADGVAEQPIYELTCQERFAPDGRIWRLSAEQYAHSMYDGLGHAVDLLLLPKDGINQKTGFNNDSTLSYVTVQLADAYWDNAKAAAATRLASEQLSKPCLSAATVDAACLETLVSEAAGKAFRRPITDEERTRFAGFFRASETAYGAAAASRMLLEAIGNSPHFLYRIELGSAAKGPVELSGYELASQLSYMLTDAPPNAALLASAQGGALADRATIARVAKELLASPRGQQKLSLFFKQYLSLNELTGGAPGVDAEVAKDMATESLTFANHVAQAPNGSLRELFTAPYTFVNARLAPLYGVTVAGSEFARVELNPRERGGLLTQLSFLSTKHGPIHRGRLIKEGLLCSPIPPPPPGASAQTQELEGPDSDATAQEKWQIFKAKPTCGQCHATFQPLGIAFDHYDELGKFRSQNPAGRGIDTSGAVVGAGDADGPFTDAVQLSAQIANSQAGQFCFTKRYMSFAQGREVSTGRDACAIKSVGDYFQESELRLADLLVAVTQDDSFYQRNNLE